MIALLMCLVSRANACLRAGSCHLREREALAEVEVEVMSLAKVVEEFCEHSRPTRYSLTPCTE